MCGIAGFVDFRGATSEAELTTLAERMATALTHRGPDDAGVWVDAAAGVALGHRRLSIVDLSAAGHQPMVSASGRYVIVYNGEVYNHGELSRELSARGRAFRGHCDTEVILAAIEEWGLEAALERSNGMFAIALWDRRDRALFLARDRFGEKPLYYGRAGGALVFGSELKAFRPVPGFDAAIHRRALTEFLRFGYVPAPRSIFASIRKLLPGTFLRVAAEADVDRPPQAYWSLADVVARARERRFTGTEEDAREELDRLVRSAVALRMVADVPLGAFLSGGIDSSTVVALMQAQSTRRVRTFTIGFHDPGYDEAPAARAVAAHLGTDHTELYVSAGDAQAVIPRLPALYDEPFADSSQIPTFLVSALARRQVTVALSGDGGDELFGGYTRYFWANRVARAMARLPGAAQAALRRALLAVRPDRWDALSIRAEAFLPATLRQRMPGDKLQKLAELAGSADEHEVYLRLVSAWKDPRRVVRGGGEEPLALTVRAQALGVDSFQEQMMFADTISYLPDDILAKVDRATMGVSLEGRIPFLDSRLADFAWSLPPEMKLGAGLGKRPLRSLLARYVPRALFERPKMGFGIPVHDWLRGPLRDWAESLLAADRLETEGFFDPAPVREVWSMHLEGTRNRHFALWPLLMFQAWHDHWQRGFDAGDDAAFRGRSAPVAAHAGLAMSPVRS